MSDKFQKLYELIMRDTIRMPKSLMAYDDISDDTRILFSVVLDKCIKEQKSKEEFVDELTNISLEEISCECFCTIIKAKIIKAELNTLLPDVDDILYLNREKG